ncbi:hypothetical protein [Rheinheimera sp.]|uniref:hypothetical protein n=1 Tax=Rheinheimera sp. TaxID=1869214 RepID=UPI0040483BCF
MSNHKKSSDKAVQVISSPISQILGSTPVLPGESREAYQQGLVATIQELGAVTPLQIYLAEKIYECLWWMRRYENQKRATLIRKMAQALDPDSVGHNNVTDLQAEIMALLRTNRVGDDLNELMARQKYDLDSLTQRAMLMSRVEHEKFDQMIALNAKNLAGFQASYEVLVNRGVNAERMRLQNALMRRDLGAIDIEPNHGLKVKPPQEAGQ